MFWVEATTRTHPPRDTLDRTMLGLKLDVERLEEAREAEETWRRADISIFGQRSKKGVTREGWAHTRYGAPVCFQSAHWRTSYAKSLTGYCCSISSIMEKADARATVSAATGSSRGGGADDDPVGPSRRAPSKGPTMEDIYKNIMQQKVSIVK